jgi:pyruvate dehydrogenase E2 component (dihydrolipoamide acetyltransferase)
VARYEFRMPTLGADMEAGTLVAWNVKPGDAVKRGQVVAVVETQKGAIDVEIWQDGALEKLIVDVGAKVPVGAVLVTLITEGEPATTAETAPEKAAAAAPQTDFAPQAAKADIQAKAGERQSQMRKAITAAMVKSKREIPHYYLGTEIGMTRALAWLERENARRPVAERMLYAVLLVKAAALALKETPELNEFWVDGAFRQGSGIRIHVGMAVAMRDGGLVAPAIHDTDKTSLPQLMGDLRDLITRVRGGRLKSSEMADPTITLTRLGELGVETVYGVNYPPQVALVGFGKISERPWAGNGAVSSRRAITATLAADHRASEGRRGALFLAAIDRLLQEPGKLQ